MRVKRDLLSDEENPPIKMTKENTFVSAHGVLRKGISYVTFILV